MLTMINPLYAVIFRYTTQKINWLKSLLHSGAMRSGSACGEAGLSCLRHVPALTY